MLIAIDFDGTCVTNAFPKVGDDIGAVPVLKRLVEAGHSLLLNTTRDKYNGLDDAIKWFKDNDIPLCSAVNQANWTQSTKLFANLYIDDAALGCPLIHKGKGRSYVNWSKVEKLLIKRGIIQ
jgi:hypothetical protein